MASGPVWFQERAFMCRSFTCNDWRLDDRKRSQDVNVYCLHWLVESAWQRSLRSTIDNQTSKTRRERHCAEWIHNFLCNRMQKVVGSGSSPSFYCTKGVPQDSVLSPLQFNIYLSDLHSLAKESSLRSFPDDITLYFYFLTFYFSYFTSEEKGKKTSSRKQNMPLCLRPAACVLLSVLAFLSQRH